MKLKFMAVAIMGLALLAVQAKAQDPAALKTQKDKVSYAIGIQIALSVKGQNVDVDPDLVGKGFKDAISGAKLLMTDDELRTTLTALQQEMKQKQMQAMSKAADDNKKAGDAFLAENGKK